MVYQKPDRTSDRVFLFAEEKSSLLRETRLIFRTLVDVPPAHARLSVDIKKMLHL